MSMMSQAEGSASMVSEGVSGTNAAQLALSPDNTAAEGAAKMMERGQPASPPEPIGNRSANARALAASIARRSRLADQIRAEHPTYTKAEIEERLEQFGA